MKILKIPFDYSIPYPDKRGSREAPDLIESRLNGKGLNSKGEFISVDVSEDFESTQHNITKTSEALFRTGEKVIGLGGDHSVNFGMLRAFSKVFGRDKVGLLFIDAHLDCEDDFLPPSHEDIIRAAVKEFVNPKNILMVGTRKKYPKEIEFVKSHGIKVIEMQKIKDKGINWLLREIKDFFKNIENIYLSLDIDVIDPMDAPGTGYPEVGGFSKADILKLCNKLKEFKIKAKIKAMDLVEVNPRLDKDDKTIDLAVEILKKAQTF